MQARRLDNRGYITLLATLIVSAFGIALASSFLYLGGSAAQSAATLERSFEARGYADACAEGALLAIEQAESYTGSDTITFSEGDCTYEVEASAGESVVLSTGVSGDVIRKVKVIASTQTIVSGQSTTTSITSIEWLEPADF